ncbi:DUF1302 family protein [Desulfobacter vibrioformis]|uniref:DUF1302 family protein n=1 Tax=Desulfobacter vibrioformis TaxID=34031 RepID=UPI00055663BD|nr:DUF1302 family protein [Desulfobacter vibrioformis]
MKLRVLFLISDQILMAVIIFSTILCQPALAQEEAFDLLLDGFDENTKISGDSLLDGFDDPGATENEKAGDTLSRDRAPEQQVFFLTGHIKTAGYCHFSHDAPVRQGTNWQGVSSLETELLLEFEIKPTDKWNIFNWSVFATGLGGYDFIYTLKGRQNYTDQVLDNYETKAELRELYLRASPVKQLDIKTGRQIVVWGTSDYVRVVDILNPLDLRNPGTTDIEDLRLPVTMSKIDYYQGPFNLSCIMIHEVRFNEPPAYGSVFYPSSQAPAREEILDSDLKNSQFALALTGRFSGWDLGLYWADIYYPDTYIESVSDGGTLVPVQKHDRVNMFGVSSTLAKGNWILKTESALWEQLRYTNTPNDQFSRLDVMAGFEYSGFTDTRITLELVNQHLFNYNSELKNTPDGINENQLQSVLCIEKDFIHEALTLTFLVMGYGEKWQDGSYQRISAEYDIADSITAKAGVVFYQSGNLPMFNDIGGNDQVFLELKFSF